MKKKKWPIYFVRDCRMTPSLLSSQPQTDISTLNLTHFEAPNSTPTRVGVETIKWAPIDMHNGIKTTSKLTISVKKINLLIFSVYICPLYPGDLNLSQNMQIEQFKAFRSFNFEISIFENYLKRETYQIVECFENSTMNCGTKNSPGNMNQTAEIIRDNNLTIRIMSSEFLGKFQKYNTKT